MWGALVRDADCCPWGRPCWHGAAVGRARLGAEVVLFEAKETLGGQFLLARNIPGKTGHDETIRHFTTQMSHLTWRFVCLKNPIRQRWQGLTRLCNDSCKPRGLNRHANCQRW